MGKLRQFYFMFLILVSSMLVSCMQFKGIDSFLKENAFQGCVLVAKQGKILFKKGYGFANEEHCIPNTTHTVFRIGSITKQFTAVALLQLQEKGVLNFHDPIKKYLPDYPEGENITVHHLLAHTSGIPSITELSHFAELQRQRFTTEQLLAQFKDLPLDFYPGSDCAYSDSGYIVLGAIIETITHMSYEEYVEKNIFLPLSMNHSYYEHNHLTIPFRASGYIKTERGVTQHADYIDMSLPHAAGALASTAEDLYKWDRSLKNGTLLKKESIDALLKVHGANAQHKIAYGYGIRVGPHNEGMENCGHFIQGHFGSINGFEAALVRYLDDDLTIIILSNVEKTKVQSFHKAIAEIVHSYWRAKRR